MTLKSKFAIDVGWALISSAVSLLFGFLLRVLLARWLGASDLGLYTLVITVQEIAVLLAEFGVSSALVKYAAEYQDDEKKLSQITSFAFLISIILGLLVGVLLFSLSGVIASTFKTPQLAHLLRILALVLPFNNLLDILSGLFNGLRIMRRYAFIFILRSCLITLFTVTFIWLGFGVEGTVFGIVLSAMVACILLLYLSRKYLRPIFRDTSINIKRLMLFGSQAFGSNAVSLLVNRADVLIVGYYLNNAEVGYYGVAAMLGTVFDIIPQAIQRITFPAASNFWSKSDYWSLQKMSDKSMKYSACLLIPLGLGVGFFAKGIISIFFGADYSTAALPLQILLISKVIGGATMLPIGSLLSGVGRPDIGLKVNTFIAILNISLDVLFIPRFGIVGAAIASTISQLGRTVVGMVFLCKIAKVKMDAPWYIRSIGLASIAVVLFWTGTQLINPYILGGSILFIYLFLVLRFFLNREDWAFFRTLVFSLIRNRQL